MADYAATNSGIVQLSDGLYDLFKQILEKVFPAAIVFYALVGGYLGWDNIVQVTGIMGGLGVFLSVVLSLARRGYSPNPEVPSGGYDGEVVAGNPQDGGPVLQFKLDPTKVDDILNKKVITFKGFDPNA